MTDTTLNLGATGIGSAMAAQVAQIRTTKPDVLAIALSVLDSLPQLTSVHLMPIINGLHHDLGGCTLYINRPDHQPPTEMDLEIWRRFDGRNWHGLAKAFGITAHEVAAAINRASAWHRNKRQATAGQGAEQASTEQTVHQAAAPQTGTPARSPEPPSPQIPPADQK